jgi:hypothetical protein
LKRDDEAQHGLAGPCWSMLGFVDAGPLVHVGRVRDSLQEGRRGPAWAGGLNIDPT